MAETLGSLIDKLSIKNLRHWHLVEALEETPSGTPKAEELLAKKELVERQQKELADEIDAFLAAALKGEVRIRDEKVKLYINRNVAPSEGFRKLGQAISELADRNIRIWHLEDEVRREDLPDADIVQFKRKIDTTNQERNDLMDRVDAILENAVKPQSGKGS